MAGTCCTRFYNWWVLIAVCLSSMGMGLPFFSYGALLPYISSLFFNITGKLTSQALLALQPVIVLMGITLTGSLAGFLEYYVNVRLLNLVLSLSYVLVIALSYFVESLAALIAVSLIMGTLGGQINVCNVARLSEWNPRKSGAANGIMGFFMGISGFVGSVLCTSVINPHNAKPEDIDGVSIFTDETVVGNIRNIWLAWAGATFIMFLPGIFILRPPTTDEVCKQADLLAGDSMESVELLPRPKIQGPNFSIKQLFSQPRFYVLYLIIMILSLVLLTSTELYKFIAIDTIKDDAFLNIVGAAGSIANAFGRITWGLILDKIGTRATYTLAFMIQGPLTISLHYSKVLRWGYLANLCIVSFCAGIFTCIAPACIELFGSRDISLKYALTLSAESFGCVMFFLLQLGEPMFGELIFLVVMGVPSIIASLLALFCFRSPKEISYDVMN